MILSVKALLIIAISVVTWGAVISALFGRSERAYLFTVSGDRTSLIIARVMIWLTAIATGLIAWYALSWVMPSIVALAIFFGFEAGALDICGQRIRFVEAPSRAPGAGPVYRRTSQG